MHYGSGIMRRDDDDDDVDDVWCVWRKGSFCKVGFIVVSGWGRRVWWDVGLLLSAVFGVLWRTNNSPVTCNFSPLADTITYCKPDNMERSGCAYWMIVPFFAGVRGSEGFLRSFYWQLYLRSWMWHVRVMLFKNICKRDKKTPAFDFRFGFSQLCP